MCTSHVAGNTQMASLDKQVTQNGLGLTMQWQVEYTMVSSRLWSLAMIRGGVGDVHPFLVSRNTLGNGKTTTQNFKDKSQTVVAESGGVLHLAMWK